MRTEGNNKCVPSAEMSFSTSFCFETMRQALWLSCGCRSTQKHLDTDSRGAHVSTHGRENTTLVCVSMNSSFVTLGKLVEGLHRKQTTAGRQTADVIIVKLEISLNT